MGKEGSADRLSPCKVDSAIASCSEMHDMKEAVHEAKKKLEGIGEDRQTQVPPPTRLWGGEEQHLPAQHCATLSPGVSAGGPR